MFKTYKNLKRLHSLYEQNFILINKISGELNKKNSFTFQVGEKNSDSSVTVSRKKLSKFTDEIEFLIEDITNIKNLVITCRLYKEATMMEVIEFQNFHKDLLLLFAMKNINLQKDERYQWNLFINQFLNYSISHGRAKKNYLPSWIQ